MSNNIIEKSAELSQEQKQVIKNWIMTGAAAGLLSAGIGLSASKAKAKKEEASNTPENSRNAIIVHILKDNFLKGVKKPEDQALLTSVPKQIQYTPTTDTQVDKSVEDMTPEEIEAKKKELLRINSRPIDFFGKRASTQNSTKNTEEKKNTSEKIAEYKSDINGDGIEKKALGWTSDEILASVKNLFLHPVDTAKGFVDQALTIPTAHMAAGATAVAVSAMLVKKINEMRANESKRKAEEAREDYVRLIQGTDSDGSEKTADDRYGTSNPITSFGALYGGALIGPAFVTAIVVNKILENRKKRNEKSKSVSNSYPENPLILYKTASNEVIEVKPETVLVSMMLKEADAKSGIWYLKPYADSAVKLLQQIPGSTNFIPSVAKKRFRGLVSRVQGQASEKDVTSMVDAFTDPKNSDTVIKLMRAKADNNITDQEKNFGKLMRAAGVTNLNVAKSLQSDPRIGDFLIKNINSDSNENWKKFREDMTGKGLSRYFRPGSMIYNLSNWIANNTGLGKYFIEKYIRNNFPAEESKKPNTTTVAAK